MAYRLSLDTKERVGASFLLAGVGGDDYVGQVRLTGSLKNPPNPPIRLSDPGRGWRGTRLPCTIISGEVSFDQEGIVRAKREPQRVNIDEVAPVYRRIMEQLESIADDRLEELLGAAVPFEQAHRPSLLGFSQEMIEHFAKGEGKLLYVTKNFMLRRGDWYHPPEESPDAVTSRRAGKQAEISEFVRRYGVIRG